MGQVGNKSHLVHLCGHPSTVPPSLPHPLTSTLESGAHGNPYKTSFLYLTAVLWVAIRGLARKKKKGKSKAESSCPNESGWEEMSRGQGRERDLSGRAKMPAHRTRHAGNQNLRWEWAGLAGTKDEREVVTAWNTHTHR